MRLTLSALVVAAGLAGFGAAAQAAPVAAPSQLGLAAASDTIVPVQMRRERRMMRHRMMRHRMVRHRMMRRRMNRM